MLNKSVFNKSIDLPHISYKLLAFSPWAAFLAALVAAYLLEPPFNPDPFADTTISTKTLMVALIAPIVGYSVAIVGIVKCPKFWKMIPIIGLLANVTIALLILFTFFINNADLP